MVAKQIDNVTVENAKFIFRPNFEGREEQYNEPGNRYFNIRVPDNIVDALTADGWNIKWTKEREEYPSEPYLEVTVGFKYRPPLVILIEDGRETQLTEQTVGLIDTLQFETMDVVIRPYLWESAMGSGVKAYLKTFYGSLAMDDLQRKYSRLRNQD